MINCASGRCTMPRIVCLVVCGLLEVIATFVPTRALVRVDFPALGRPTKQANPERKPSSADWPLISVTRPLSHVACAFTRQREIC